MAETKESTKARAGGSTTKSGSSKASSGGASQSKSTKSTSSGSGRSRGRSSKREADTRSAQQESKDEGRKDEGRKDEAAETEESGAAEDTSQSRAPSSAGRAAREAAKQLSQLTTRPIQAVVGVERSKDQGWMVTLEIVETARIPNTTDVLAEYEVDVSEDGELLSYRRARRYLRGKVGAG